MPRGCGHDYFRRDCSCSRLVREAWLFLHTVDGAGCITAVFFELCLRGCFLGISFADLT